MDEKKFRRRGIITACIAPVVWMLVMIGQWTGLWDQAPGSELLSVYIAILMVEMIVGTAAPFWWLLTWFRRRSAIQARPTLLIGLNLFALAISILYFF